MHPLQHLSMLITGLILLGTRYEKFYEISGTCPENTEGAAFIAGDKEKFMTYAMTAHAAACILHWFNQIFNHFEMKVIATFFTVAKMIIFFIIMIKIQSGTDFDDKSGAECVEVIS